MPLNPSRTTIVAEIGENHLGDWTRARRMIEEAASAGADVVKFQSYLGAEVAADDPERDWFSQVEVPNAVHFDLKRVAEQNGVEFMSSPFSPARARFLVEELGLRRIKVASSEMLNFAMLDYLNGQVESVWISTGLASLREVGEALAHLEQVPDVCVLQCTTQYPCPPEQVNLAAIRTLADAFPHRRVGYSDHTLDILAPVAAVALGAAVVEKHFTLDKSLPGTDHVLSATPAELREMVAQIRRVETLLGSAEKAPTPGELPIASFVRSRFPKA